jgi:peptidoglycan DL-endopeptidase CwlO
VEDDRTVWIIHRVRRGVVRYRMNLDRPDVRFDKSGRILNDYLRFASPRDKHVLTAQLFAAYATVLPIGGKPLATASDSTEPSAGPPAALQRSREEAFKSLGGT